MRATQKCLFAAAAGSILIVPALLLAFSTGPDAGHSGVPGESTCRACHGNISGSGSVSVSFSGGGQTYTPGANQHLTVTVADPAQRRWGFQLTARLASDAKSMAGSLTPGGDGFTQIACAAVNLTSQTIPGPTPCPASQPLQYIEHTSTGTRLGQAQSASFEFDWTPPASNAGDVIIYVAGNAANGDSTPSGDHIYTASYTLKAVSAGKPPVISDNGVVNSWGNQTTISEGSFVSIYGSGFGGHNTNWNNFVVGGKLPTSLEGISVKIGGQDAFVNFVGDTQINVLAPTGIGAGSVPVVVTNANGTSNTVMATAQALAPSCYNLSGLVPGSEKYIGAFVLEADGSFTRVGPPGLLSSLGIQTRAAKPGEVVLIFGTGWGSTNPPAPVGQVLQQPFRMTNTVNMTIGGAPVQFLDNGFLVFAGEYQFNIKIPEVTAGGDLPVAADIIGVPAQGNLLITIQK